MVNRPLLAVGLVVQKILFVLSEETVSTAEPASLIAMIAMIVAALILVSGYDRTEGWR